MAEANEAIEPSAEAIEAEAKQMGWVPEAEFKGYNGAKWSDAQEFVENGRRVLPILRKNNQQLHATVSQQAQALAATQREVAALKAAMGVMEETQEADVQERVKAERASIKQQLIQAKTDGNTALEVELTDQLGELRQAETKAKVLPAALPAEAQQQPLTPEYLAWQAKNADWVDVDTEKTAIAFALGNVVARAGFRGQAFFEELDKRLDAKLARPAAGRQESKTEAGSNGGARSTAAGGERTAAYADLTAEEKAACDSFEQRMVGAKRAHKDRASWRASYAAQAVKLREQRK